MSASIFVQERNANCPDLAGVSKGCAEAKAQGISQCIVKPSNSPFASGAGA
jgi:hypothetical protein